MNKYYVEVLDHSTRWYCEPECWTLHRVEGPAIEYANGHGEWFRNGLRHNSNGPAITWADGDKWWYKHGQRHREDGPAFEGARGKRLWFLEDKCVSEEEHARLTAPAQEMTVAQIEAALGHKVKVVK